MADNSFKSTILSGKCDECLYFHNYLFSITSSKLSIEQVFGVMFKAYLQTKNKNKKNLLKSFQFQSDLIVISKPRL